MLARRVTRAGILVLLLAAVALSAPPSSVRAAGAELSVHTVGEVPLENGTTPVLVAGVWNQITVNLTTPMNGGSLTLRAFLPGASPSGTANTYEWVRNEANNSWADLLYGTFLRPDLSVDTGFQITFGVGIDAQATPGLWTLSAAEGNTTIATMTLEVQAPHLAYGISAADFAFRIDPFTAASLSSIDANQYLQITNSGNVPLGLNVGFDILAANLSLTNPATIAHVGSQGVYYIALTLGPMPPEIIRVNGLTDLFVAYAIPSAGGSGLVPTFQQRFGVTVTVGRAGYDLQTISNVAFQTLDTVATAYGAVATWQVFLTGSQAVSLNVTVSGARLLGLFAGGAPLTLPVQLTLAGNSETMLTIQILADQSGAASVAFSLHLLGTGEMRTFTTTLQVSGPPASTQAPQASLLWVVGAVAASALFSFVALGQLRHSPKLKRIAARRTAAAESDRTMEGEEDDGNEPPTT